MGSENDIGGRKAARQLTSYNENLSVPVIVVIVSAVAHNPSVRNAHVKGSLNAESQEGSSWDPNGSALHLTAAEGSDNRTYQAVIALRFYAVCISS